MGKSDWKGLERRTLRLVSRYLEASYYDGGSKCTLAGYQIDAYGIFGRAALIFECKTTRNSRRINISQAVAKLAGIRSVVQQALRAKHGRQLRYFRFVVVVDSASEIARFNRRRRRPRNIYLWTPKYFDAVEGLAKGIGKRALPYVLRELGMEAKVGVLVDSGRRWRKLPALRVSLGESPEKEAFYSFFSPASLLLDLGYVARIESNQPKAYQRLLNRSRLKNITQYINEGGSFKNSVVVSLPKTVSFRRLSTARLRPSRLRVESGFLRFPMIPASLWIIDGQHRIYGYAHAHPIRLDSPLSVVGVSLRDSLDQGKIFVDINKNQKPVDPNVLWDLYFQLSPDEPAGAISQLVRDLTHRRGSVLRERIYTPALSTRPRRRYSIYMANVCEAVKKQALVQLAVGLNSKVPLKKLSAADLKKGSDRVFKRFNAFCKSLKSVCYGLKSPRWWNQFFLTNNGISVGIRIFRELLLYPGMRFKRQELGRVLRKPLAAYFEHMRGKLDDVIRNTSSEGGRDATAIDILMQMNKLFPRLAEDKLRAARRVVREDVFFKTIRDFETGMREILPRELGKLSGNWWEERVPADVKEKIEQRWEQDQKRGSRADYLDIADYMRIISHNWKDCFEGHFGRIRKDKSWVSLKLQELGGLRNRYFHFHGSVVPSEQEMWQARILTSQLLEPFRGRRIARRVEEAA